jgi:hypothetical protein
MASNTSCIFSTFTFSEQESGVALVKADIGHGVKTVVSVSTISTGETSTRRKVDIFGQAGRQTGAWELQDSDLL